MLTFPVGFFSSASKPFKMLIDTTKAGSASDTFIIPTYGSGYDAEVDWGDGNTTTISGTPGDVSHTYSSGGEYVVKIRELSEGGFPRIYFNSAGDKLKLMEVQAWGTVAWSTMGKAFNGCSNLTLTATDNPNTKNVTSLLNIFRGCHSITSVDITGWDIGNVTNMSYMCSSMAGLTSFDCSGCNTAKVTSFSNMLRSSASLSSFDMSDCDTSNVTDMEYMFYECSSCNPDVSGFDITSLTTAKSMMQGSGFNQTNYDLLLVAWEAQSENSNVVFHAGSAKYGAGAPATAKGVLVNTSGWTINDGGAA